MDLIKLSVANLSLGLDARASVVNLVIPDSYARFLVSDGRPADLELSVRYGRPPQTEGWSRLFDSHFAWTLWLDDEGRQVFVPAAASPPSRFIFVEQGFSRGEVLVVPDTTTQIDRAHYPLLDIDIMIYANWLAGYGDLIIHAAGVEDSGEGYCFVGPSGAGKSTLATGWSDQGWGMVVGDDQVILRYLSGRFWIFGTPWHQQAHRHDPRGVPLAKIFFLDREQGDAIRSCDPDSAAIRLFQNSFAPLYEPAGVSKILGNLARLVERVPAHSLGLWPDAGLRDRVRGA